MYMAKPMRSQLTNSMRTFPRMKENSDLSRSTHPEFKGIQKILRSLIKTLQSPRVSSTLLSVVEAMAMRGTWARARVMKGSLGDTFWYR